MPENTIVHILKREELKQAVADLRQQKKTIVVTNGCFDILHSGHLRLLNSAKALGDILIVGINSDRSVSKLKGPKRPVVSESDRAEIVSNLKAVDFVTVFDEDTAVDLLKIIKPDIYVKGGDYNLKNLPEAPAVESFGGTIKFIQFVPGKSTSEILEKIKSL